jgi:hypothetical protein
MKYKILIPIIFLLSIHPLIAKEWSFIEKVPSDYYDKKAEGILVPVRSCNYVVDFEVYGRKVSVGGGRKIHRKLQSYLPSITMNKMVYTSREHYDGFHKEERYKYFLVQIPPKGYMQLNFMFTDRMGNIYKRSQKVYKARRHQRFPSPNIVPKRCKRDGHSRHMQNFRER